METSGGNEVLIEGHPCVHAEDSSKRKREERECGREGVREG